MNVYRLIHWLSRIEVRGSGRLAELVRKIFLPPMRSNMIIRTAYGFLLKIDPVQDVGIERNLYFNGSYEMGTLHVLKHILREGAIVLDVGSNIGLMSIFAALRVGEQGQVIAFEPHPHTFSILEFNIALNELSNLTLVNKAVGSINTTTTLYDRQQIGRGAATLIRPENNTTNHEVEQIRLDDYLASGPRIDLIKIDIEGRELDALIGAGDLLTGTNPPVLIVEYSRDNGSQEALYDFLRSVNRYRLFKFSRWKGKICPLIEINEKEELPEHDNICCFTEEHLQRIPSKLFN